MDDKKHKEHLMGILKENRDHPPKPKRIKCGRCKKRDAKALTCSLYPEGIPEAILEEQETCLEFQVKQNRRTEQMCQGEKDQVRNRWKIIVESGKENMDNFIPRNAVKLCNKCRLANKGEFTCQVYPEWIPDEMLMGDCPNFKPEENMDNFIPRNAVKLCNQCVLRNKGTVTCKVYPKRIPHEVLVGDCPKFKPEQK